MITAIMSGLVWGLLVLLVLMDLLELELRGMMENLEDQVKKVDLEEMVPLGLLVDQERENRENEVVKVLMGPLVLLVQLERLDRPEKGILVKLDPPVPMEGPRALQDILVLQEVLELQEILEPLEAPDLLEVPDTPGQLEHQGQIFQWNICALVLLMEDKTQYKD